MPRILTARDQVALLSPWRLAVEQLPGDPGQSFFVDDAAHQAHLDEVQRKLDEFRRNGEDSRTMYGEVLGPKRVRWDPARRRQHRELVNEIWDESGAQAPAEGSAIVLGGAPGSGKGEAQRVPGLLNVRKYFVNDPDRIKHKMAERGMIPEVEGLSPMEASPLVHEEASELAQQLAQRAYKERRNILWDITMSSEKSVADRIKDMRKAGYKNVDAAFVDADLDTARQRAVERHRRDEEPYRRAGQGLGGRPVPNAVYQAMNPTPGSGHTSRYSEVFSKVRPHFDSSAVIDMRGKEPKVVSTHGRWSSPEQQPLTARRATAQDVPSVATLRGLIEAYENGEIDFRTLAALASRIPATPRDPQAPHAGWHEVYQRAEEMPDEDSPFWITVAEDLGVLTPEEADHLHDALGGSDG